MTNHAHLVPTPSHERALASLCQELCGPYAAMINRRDHTTGHLWQGRAWSCPLDELHLCRTLRYVELNPVRAGLLAAYGQGRQLIDDALVKEVLDTEFA
jgi:putative transposase